MLSYVVIKTTLADYRKVRVDMSYKIVVDSCCELPKELLTDDRYERVPLSLEVGDYCIQDDESFNQTEFLKKVAACPVCPKSACPSPEKYMEAYETEAERVYAITLSGHLSGSHNSAEIGKSLFQERHKEKKICVFDSLSASGGETQIALKIRDLEIAGFSFEEIIEKVQKFRDEMETFFVLDNLETLRKNGRLSRVKALVASTMNIKPIMAADKGTIVQRAQGIGMRKALNKMAEFFVKEVKEGHNRLIISHCNARERAEAVKKAILSLRHFDEVLILDTAGISSMYANDGGIIVTA